MVKVTSEDGVTVIRLSLKTRRNSFKTTQHVRTPKSEVLLFSSDWSKQNKIYMSLFSL